MELHGSGGEVNNGTAWVARGQQWNGKGHDRSTMELLRRTNASDQSLELKQNTKSENLNQVTRKVSNRTES